MFFYSVFFIVPSLLVLQEVIPTGTPCCCLTLNQDPSLADRIADPIEIDFGCHAFDGGFTSETEIREILPQNRIKVDIPKP